VVEIDYGTLHVKTKIDIYLELKLSVNTIHDKTLWCCMIHISDKQLKVFTENTGCGN
jgi:hypothetical protein